MDNFLQDAVVSQMPELNKRVVEGLAMTEMENAEAFIARAWECASVDFPPGLKYEGYRRVPAREAYRHNVKRGSSPTLEIAKTTTFMIAHQLSYKGEMLNEAFSSLLFVEQGGIFYIRGTRYGLSPVAGDLSLSVGENSIFLPLLRDRMTFMRFYHQYIIDDLPDSAGRRSIVWGAIHNDMQTNVKPGGNKMVTILTHYFFARYGFTQAMKDIGGADVIVGTPQSLNDKTHSPEEWRFCRSTKQFPGTSKSRRNYVPTDIVVAVRRSQWSDTVANLLAGFFYIADYYPYRVIASEVDEPYLWQVLLGTAIWGTGNNEGQLAIDIGTHLNSLNGYIDNEARKDLAMDGIDVKTIDDLFLYLNDNYSRLVQKAYPNLPSMYGKRLMILRYILKDLVREINLFMYRVNSNHKKTLTVKDIEERLRSEIKSDTILRVNTGHGEVHPSVPAPGDNMFFKITSRVVRQEKSSGAWSRGTSLTDRANFLHVSVAEAGSYLTPGGSDATGHERINACVTLDENNMIIQCPDTAELTNAVEEKIQRR